MEWLLAMALAVCLLAILELRQRIKNLLILNANIERRADHARAADNALVVAALAREIANELMQRDEQKYLKRFERLYYKWGDIKNGNEKAKQAHIQTITSKYKNFADYDNLNTKSHVLYADGFSWKSDDDLWELYESIRLYDALSCELDENWRPHGTSIAEKEFEHLKGYCQKLNDTKLLAHLHKARDEYWNLRRNNAERKSSEEAEWLYQTKDYCFRPVHHVAEIRVGVYVKSLDRYGIWGVFDGDGGVTFTSFYSADLNFNEEFLDILNIRVCLDARSFERIEKIKC